MTTTGIAIRVLRAGGLVLGLSALGVTSTTAADTGKAEAGRLSEGRELFLREWTPGDPRSPRGDGLGPVFNDSSCVACHNAGGSGGGGPSSKNVDIVTAVFNGPAQQAPNDSQAPADPPPYLVRAGLSLLGIAPSKPSPDAPSARPSRPDTSKLIEAHPGFRSARSVVLHKSSVDPGYESWRATMTGANQRGLKVDVNLTGTALAEAEISRLEMMARLEVSQMRAQVQLGEFELVHSQRNPTALFGIGLIDAIPDRVIEAASAVKYPEFPEIAGRVARRKDGRIGRFGWKAQTPSLNDFVLTACAVELGLEVPGHPQAGLPRPTLKTASQSACKVELAVGESVVPHKAPLIEVAPLDLTAGQCSSLEGYVRALPKPVELNRGDKEVEAGRALFSKAGCVACHSPNLGDVSGLYSDMLVHDMGADMGDTGSYTPFIPDSEDPDFIDPPVAEAVASDQDGPASIAKVKTGPAGRQEWRTPPLWGVRDSSPYLHDGRAPTLERAIALHGGQGGRSARAYFALTARERLQVQAFLKSLAAPDEAAAYTLR